MSNSSSPHPKLLNRFDLREMGITHVNVSLIRMERAGKFPKRIRLSPQKVAWIESEVLEWIENKAKERN